MQSENVLNKNSSRINIAIDKSYEKITISLSVLGKLPRVLNVLFYLTLFFYFTFFLYNSTHFVVR